ncbi:RDD family protein [Nocardia sp. NPDC005366]|uniref:RDD family protein n=1 Tax=Nocardia sp. NPDC005366 TaxID=3156878 RepID=UPI0033AB4C09
MSYSGSTAAPPAMSWPTTKAAARRGKVVRWSLLLFGSVCLPLTVVLIDIRDRLESMRLSALAGVCMNFAAIGATVGLIFGGGLLWMNRRRHRALTRHPWIVWPINYISTGRYEWVELLDQNRQPVSALILSTWPKDIGKLVNHTTSEVWFAGDPMKYGVLSRPGGGDLRYAYSSKARQPPRFDFGVHNPSDQEDHGDPVSVTPKYELTRERGQLMMKPVGAQAEEPIPHGAKGDTRYGSPRMLRRVLAFAFDCVVHLGVALGAAIAVSPAFSIEAATRFDWKHLGVNPIIALGFWLSASAADRVFAQAVFHTTVGKALFGLRVIRPDDGAYPSFGRLLAVWLVDLYMVVAVPIALVTFSDVPGPDKIDDYFLPAVRSRDLQQRE